MMVRAELNNRNVALKKTASVTENSRALMVNVAVKCFRLVFITVRSVYTVQFVRRDVTHVTQENKPSPRTFIEQEKTIFHTSGSYHYVRCLLAFTTNTPLHSVCVCFRFSRTKTNSVFMRPSVHNKQSPILYCICVMRYYIIS